MRRGGPERKTKKNVDHDQMWVAPTLVKTERKKKTAPHVGRTGGVLNVAVKTEGAFPEKLPEKGKPNTRTLLQHLVTINKQDGQSAKRGFRGNTKNLPNRDGNARPVPATKLGEKCDRTWGDPQGTQNTAKSLLRTSTARA